MASARYPLQPQGRQAEQEADDETGRARGRKGGVIRKIGLVHQDRRGIGADPVKRAVPERELAIEAGQQVEPEDRERVDHHQRQLEHDKALADQRYQQSDDQDPGNCPVISRGLCRTFGGAEGGVERDALPGGMFRRAHTRLTTRRPKIPAGRTISTATIRTSAIVSFSSRPT